MFFRIMLAINAAVCAVLLFFFAWELVDGPPSEGAAMLLLLACVSAAAIALALALRRNGHNLLGLLVLAPIAWVGGGYGLFLLSVLILQPSFR